MNENETKTKVVDSGLKVSLPTKEVVIERKMTADSIADDMVSRITAKLVGFGDLYDPKTQQFLSESELKAKGAVFVTIAYKTKAKLNKKDRITKEPCPYDNVVKTSKYQVIANVNWASYVNKRGHGSFIPAEARANGVENYCDCKGIGKTKAGNSTINGVAFRVIEKAKYYNNGVEIDSKCLVNYLPDDTKSKQREADKHGIELRFDPQYRTTRIDSCEYVRAFGFRYIPIENIG